MDEATGCPAVACAALNPFAYSGGWFVYSVKSRAPVGEGTCMRRVPVMVSTGDFWRPNTA